MKNLNLVPQHENLVKELENCSYPEFVEILKIVIQRGHADRLREVADALEITVTPTAFDGTESTFVLCKVAVDYSLKWWMEKASKSLCRTNVIEYWDFFMIMAGQRGFTSSGHINNPGQTTNLWKATANLARKMQEFPADYCYLPPLLINNPQLVEETLCRIKSPYAFLEVLTGESWEDMVKCPDFLSAFSIHHLPEDNNSQKVEGCVSTIIIALQSE